MDNYDDPQSGKLAKKIKENPFMPIGICGLIGVCAYGALKFKDRGKMSPSVYLIHLRVGAQGAVVGTLVVGVLYNIFREHIFNEKK